LPQLSDAPPATAEKAGAAITPDRRDGAVYVLDEDLTIAADVALATGRPLLLRGLPGSGKSSFAAFLARNLGWRYYEHVVTSRTRARDLLYTYDTVRRLADASNPQRGTAALDDYSYVDPGVLWWTFDRASASRRGAPAGRDVSPADEPLSQVNRNRPGPGAVVLLDEIDKADPDVPNGLLVPLGSAQFQVSETGAWIHLSGIVSAVGQAVPYLIILTTNEERELPPAFLRRCIVHQLPRPSRTRLIDIGRRHLRQRTGQVTASDERLLEGVATRLDELHGTAAASGRREPSAAEYLDAVLTCRALGVDVNSPIWSRLERLVLRKDASTEGSH
jgi:MoxR-like ATPase